jgi:hypothetical protein
MYHPILEIVNNPPDESSFWVSLSGSFIGTATALLVFFLESRRERNRVRSKKKENYRNGLLYFKLLLKGIVRSVNSQAEAYKDHAEEIINNPFQVIALKISTTHDIDRILNKSDLERLLQSYLQEYGSGIENIKEFKDIISCLDYLDSTISEILQKQTLYSKTLEDNLLRYKELSEENVLKKAVELITYIQQNNSDYENDKLYNTINNIVADFYKNISKPFTFTKFQTSLIQPLTESIIKDFRKNTQAMMIADDCRKATWVYQDIIFKGKGIAVFLSKYHEDIIFVLSQLSNVKKIFDDPFAKADNIS